MNFETILSVCRAPIVAFDCCGEIHFANPEACKVLADPRGELVGQNVLTMLPVEYRLELQSLFDDVSSGSHSVPDELVLPIAQQAAQPSELLAKLDVIEDNSQRLIVATFSVQKESNSELLPSSGKSSSLQSRIDRNLRIIELAESHTDSVLITDNHHNVIWINGMFENTFNADIHSITGKSVDEVFAPYQESLSSLITAFKANKLFKLEAKLTIAGQVRYLGFSLSPIINSGSISGHILHITDVTENRRLQYALVEKTAVIENISNIAQIGYYKLDFITDELTWSDQVYKLHELPLETPVNLEMAVKFYAKDAQPIITKAVENSVATGESFDLELPFVTAKNRPIWVRAVGYVEFDKQQPVALRGAFQDITSLRESAMQAEEGLQAKSVFLANMSHELRTPINGILGLSELLAEKVITGKKREYVTAIQQSASWLLTLVNQVLQYSKSATLVEQLNETVVELDSFFNTLCFSHRIVAEKKGLSFEFKASQDLPKTVLVDAMKLQQVVHNLLSNAIKFTDTGSVVVTLACSDNNTLLVAVKDTGIGIAKADIPNLFEAFTQADMSLTRKFQGTGLGLSICKQLVKVLNGDIKVVSELNTGTLVRLEVPVVWQNLEALEENNTQSNDQTPNTDISGKHVLVVEDNDINQMIFSEVLQAENLNVKICHDGVDALEYLATNPQLDLIFMDCQMPRMDGYQCTRHIRLLENPVLSQVAIIAATAHAMDDDTEKCLAAGMNDVLIKPFAKAQLINMLHKFLS